MNQDLAEPEAFLDVRQGGSKKTFGTHPIIGRLAEFWGLASLLWLQNPYKNSKSMILVILGFKNMDFLLFR